MARKRQILVLGLGRFGSAVATTLSDLDCEVACADTDERRVQRVAPLVTQAMQLDTTDRDALTQIGVSDFDVAVVAIGADIEASILTTANLSELGCRDIVAKAMTLPHARILEKVGAHRVIFPEHEMGVRLGNSLAGTNLIDYMELDPRYAVAEIRCPAEIAGRTLVEANVARTLRRHRAVREDRRRRRRDPRRRTSGSRRATSSSWRARRRGHRPAGR